MLSANWKYLFWDQLDLAASHRMPRGMATGFITRTVTPFQSLWMLRCESISLRSKTRLLSDFHCTFLSASFLFTNFFFDSFFFWSQSPADCCGYRLQWVCTFLVYNVLLLLVVIGEEIKSLKVKGQQMLVKFFIAIVPLIRSEGERCERKYK